MVASTGIGLLIFVRRGCVSTLAGRWSELTSVEQGLVVEFIGLSRMLTLACECWELVGVWTVTLEAVLTLLWSVW